MLPAFLRPACLAPAAAGAGLFVWLVPINEGPAGTALVVAFVWLFLAYAIHAVRDLGVAVREMASRKPMRASRAGAPAAAAAQHAAPVLGAQGRAAVRDIVALFADAGVFAPSAPEPGHLFEAAADLGEPVTLGVVLMSRRRWRCGIKAPWRDWRGPGTIRACGFRCCGRTRWRN